ncbi:hypothetical protein B484DRAFT_201478 [Ochromonadaceae sp. CCMP2298]|nr:hypothetical protein B484DRAFT_201478 [Ochromonadaceae sp. CCMP2298]
MLTGVWRDYPGPVLGTWEEYAAMAQGHDAASLDALQGRVREWYAAFRSQEKQGLKELLLAVMGSGNSGDSSNSAGLDSRSSGGGSGSGGTGIGIDGMLEDKGKGVGGADVGGAIAVDDKEPLRVLQPLRFGDITPGQYRENLQALLAMVLKQEARIRQLEGAIQTLTLQQHQ